MQVIGNIVGIESGLSPLNDAVNYTLSWATVTLPDNKLSRFHPYFHFFPKYQKQNNSVSSYVAQMKFYCPIILGSVIVVLDGPVTLV